MPNRLTFYLRFLAASLLAGAGVGHIASLWFRELDERAVAALLLGAAYLIIAIGLFGQSRFTLFVSICVPLLVAFSTLQQTGGLHMLHTTSIAVNLIVAALSITVLWQVRNRPSQ